VLLSWGSCCSALVGFRERYQSVVPIDSGVTAILGVRLRSFRSSVIYGFSILRSRAHGSSLTFGGIPNYVSSESLDAVCTQATIEYLVSVSSRYLSPLTYPTS